MFNVSVRKFLRRTTAALLVFAFAIGAPGAQTAHAAPQSIVVGWGWDGYGQSTVPNELTDVTAIAAGTYHSLALKSNGTVVAWGDNGFGQSTVPNELMDVTAIAAGSYHNLALKSDSTVVAWGWDGYGQLTVPNGLMDVTAIAAGGFHNLALKSDGTVVAWGYNGYGQSTVPNELTDVTAIAAGGFHNLALVMASDTIAPVITITTPAEGAVYLLGQTVNADYSCQDEAGGSGLASCVGDVANGSPIDTGSVGAKTFTVNAADNAGNPASVTHNYSVVYNFNGFSQPVDNLPTLNLINAGKGVAVKFSLSGDQGLAILAAGYPISEQIACEGGMPLDTIEQTVTASSSSLSYDPATDTYIYKWKTERTWAGTCRQLIVRLSDGTEHMANFKFK